MLIPNRDHLTFSYFYARCSDVENAARRILLEKSASSFNIGLEDFNVDMLSRYDQEPGGKKKKKGIIFAPVHAPNHSVFISNLSDGWFTLVNSLCAELRADCVTASIASDARTYPLNAVRVYKNGAEVRLVRVMLDNERWEFFEKGGLLSFEDVCNYKKRRIKDRLNKNIMEKYLDSLGIDINSRLFWESSRPASIIFEV